ncbi:MAG: OmpH family outer membrane protein [Gemmatimonas sp.]
MRKLFVTGMSTLALVASASAVEAQAAGVKVAYVNSQALFEAVPGRAEAAAQLQKESAAVQEQFKAMQDTIAKLQEAVNKETATLAQAEKMKALKDKETVFNERADKLRGGLDERTAELQQPLMDNIQKVLEDYRSENGLTMIFDVASGQGIAAIDKNLDVTDKVRTRLLKMPAPKITAAGAAAPAATKPAPAGPAANPAGLGKKPPTK